MGHGTDTENTDEHSKHSKQLCKPFPALSHAFFDVIERTAEDGAVFADFAVFDGEQAFGIFGCHAEERGDLHPEQSTRAAACDSGCHADDVAGADGGREGGAEGTEAGDIAFAVFFVM